MSDIVRTLEVVTPAEVYDLTTLQKLKLDLNLGSDDDVFLAGQIATCSAEISAYLNQAADTSLNTTIGREVVKETMIGACGKSQLFLGRRPIATLDAITEDGTTTERLIGDPLAVNPAFGFHVDGLGVMRKRSGGYFQTFHANEIAVQYTCGWLLPGQDGRTLPVDIETACIVHVSRRLDQIREGDFELGRIQSESIQDVGGVTYAVSPRDYKNAISGEVRTLLDRYVNRSIA